MLASCAAHVKVTHLSRKAPDPAPRFSNGIYYALPRTVIKAEVPVERTYSEPALFRQYALIFFPELAQRDSPKPTEGSSGKPALSRRRRRHTK